VCSPAAQERHRVKQLLAAQELLFPRLYGSLLRAMIPLMSKNRTGQEKLRLTAHADDVSAAAGCPPEEEDDNILGAGCG